MGVEREVIRPGTGPKPTAGQNVTVHCTGYAQLFKNFCPACESDIFALSVDILTNPGDFSRKRKNGDLSQKFWSTKDPGQKPFSFTIGKGSVIKGWDEGVMQMQLGEVARLRCTPDYAYGAGGFPAWGIQPNSVLVFEIEFLSAQ